MTQIDRGTPAWLRVHNDRTAFRLILEHGPLTRSRLGELSGLSKPTASQMLARLARAELVHPVGTSAGKRGPAAISYGVRVDLMSGVAITMLPDAMECVLVDASGVEHPIVTVPLEGAERNPETDVRLGIASACAAAQIDAGSVEVVVVGVPAAVWDARDTLSLTNTLPGWPAVGARERLERALGIDVALENDVKLATLAERACGVVGGERDFVLLWLGLGIGVGIDLDGTVLRGASGSAGEVGYLSTPSPNGSGVVEATDVIGGAAVCTLLGASPGADFLETVSRLGDIPDVLAVLAERIAGALDPVLAVLDPALVVLGGPTGTAGGHKLATLVDQHINREAHPVLVVRASGAGASAVLLGARQRLVSELRDRLEARIFAS